MKDFWIMVILTLCVMVNVPGAMAGNPVSIMALVFCTAMWILTFATLILR
jgi:hypothetical protein